MSGNSDRFTDPRDGQSYLTVEINGKTWMAENLRYDISGSWCFEDISINCLTHGRLYTWYAANRACPQGWHLPTQQEWKDLAKTLGGYQEVRTDHIEGDPQAAYHAFVKGGKSGMEVILSGLRFPEDNGYSQLGRSSYFWAQEEKHAEQGENLVISGISQIVLWNNTLVEDKNSGFSCRCVKD